MWMRTYKYIRIHFVCYGSIFIGQDSYVPSSPAGTMSRSHQARRAKTGSEQKAEFCRPLAAVHSLDQVLLKRRKGVRFAELILTKTSSADINKKQIQPPYQICDILLSELWVRSFSQPMCSLGKGAFARAHTVFSCRFAPAHKVAASHADLETLPCFESVCRSIATPLCKIYKSKKVFQ